jgi:hypothetical protein
MIIPSNLGDIGGMVATAMTTIKKAQGVAIAKS